MFYHIYNDLTKSKNSTNINLIIILNYVSVDYCRQFKKSIIFYNIVSHFKLKTNRLKQSVLQEKYPILKKKTQKGCNSKNYQT